METCVLPLRQQQPLQPHTLQRLLLPACCYQALTEISSDWGNVSLQIGCRCVDLFLRPMVECTPEGDGLNEDAFNFSLFLMVQFL